MIGLSSDRELKENPRPGHPYSSPRKIRFTNSPYWDHHRLVEAELLAHLRHELGRRLLAREVDRRIGRGITKKIT